MAVVYIIYSAKPDKYYVGAATNVTSRLYGHNIGLSKFTRAGIPWVFKYTETFNSLPEAKKREAYIKKMKSGKYIESLLG